MADRRGGYRGGGRGRGGRGRGGYNNADAGRREQREVGFKL